MIANAIAYLPTIIPPKHWSSPYDGGYYGESMLHTHLIRLKVGWETNAIKTYTKKLGMVDLGYIYSALNAMQDALIKFVNSSNLSKIFIVFTSSF